ncbi:MAG TPA: HAMP domain-containing sensor histidine kinase [Methylophilaceae bacterium]|nr:HAMP domain-containing sensor histidine kinase [Methylophilaceae bacterium]
MLIGFALAMLPLLFAFGNAALYLDRLASQSRGNVTDAVQASRTSRVLVEQLTQMERSARQYFVLNDRTLLDNYSKAHETFRASVNDLQQLSHNQQQQNALKALAKRENALYQEIMSSTPEILVAQTIIERFIDLSNRAQVLLAENNQLIDIESTVLAETAERTQKILLSHTLILVPVALLVAIVITFLVAQPIRHMDAAIRRLGEGHYDEIISIDGPGDLRILGERLNWLRAQLEELDQQKQRFMRHVSHELKTPLTAIREGSELLSDEVGGALSAQQREIVGILRESSKRLQKMIENLLNYSAVQFQQPQMNIQQVDLIALLDDIVASYTLTLQSKQIEIQRDLRAVELQGDQDKIHTIIDNLLSNAIKYSPRSGKIRISIKQVAQSAVIEVHDDGPGILPADRERLFDAFYHGSGNYESLVSSTGLGLSIAKEYVLAHGGKISVLPSEQGAHFRVRLPIEPISSESRSL